MTSLPIDFRQFSGAKAFLLIAIPLVGYSYEVRRLFPASNYLGEDARVRVCEATKTSLVVQLESSIPKLNMLFTRLEDFEACLTPLWRYLAPQSLFVAVDELDEHGCAGRIQGFGAPFQLLAFRALHHAGKRPAFEVLLNPYLAQPIEEALQLLVSAPV